MARVEGSFRDPWGAVHDVDGRILRTLSPEAAEAWDAVAATGFTAEAQARRWLIGAEPVEAPPDELRDAARVVEHPRIPTISYPYEWCFGQLQAAALLHLDLQRLALDKGVVLRDATAYNVQFQGGTPVFIDALSFRPYRPGELWLGQQQFVTQFLAPLLLESKASVAFQPLYRGHLDGIPMDQAARMLPWTKWLSPTVVVNLLLPDLMQRRAHGSKPADLEGMTKRQLPIGAYRSMVDGLHAFIAGLTPHGGQTTWSDYSVDNTYAAEEAEKKQAFIGEFVAATRPGVVLDLGCNAGVYSEVALRAGAGRVVGFDLDASAVERAFRRSREKALPFLPLVQDLANPSPGLGWALDERPPLGRRVKADAALALALEHHLLLGRNIPPAAFFDWLLAWAPRGVVEFVQKSDPTVQVMLAVREDVFPGYGEEEFRRHLEARARVVKSVVTTAAGRTLFWYET